MTNGSTFCAELENKVSQGTKQGTYVRLCSKMFDDSPHHSYAVVVANSLAQLTQILGIGDAPDAAT